MYDELIKRLRERAQRENDYYEHGGDVIIEAADAIELLDMITDNMNYLYKTEVPKWIPVTERLPETRTRCVTISRDGDYGLGMYTTDYGWMFPYYVSEVTHWMRLPEPPKGDA